MGDNFHQRAFIRQYLKEYDQVWLETSWPVLYWDLIPQGLKVIHKDSNLRTQAKNAIRERSAFCRQQPPHPSTREDKQIWYRAKDIRHTGSVLGAMGECLQRPVGEGDFRFPIKDEWQQRFVNEILPKFDTGGKPILVYRPLVERTEWSGCNARNPDHYAFRALYSSIRNRFYVVSVADIEPGKEWLAGSQDNAIRADIEFHKGELTVELLATLVKNAAMTLCSPGFAVIMSQAVGTPVCCVFGGYENSISFSAGAKWGPYLGIDPINSCQCFMHHHACDKRINLPEAVRKLQGFTDEAISRYHQHHATRWYTPEASASFQEPARYQADQVG